MASYAAVISLRQTILQFRYKCPPTDFYNSTREAIDYAKKVVDSLKEVLRRRSSSSGTSVVDGEIRDAAHQLQDELESFFSDQLPLGKISPQIHRSIKDLAELKDKYEEELRKKPSLTEKVNVADFGGNNSEMVGFSVEYEMLKRQILDGGSRGCKVVFLVGMGGSGKTTLAKTIFEDAKISNSFRFLAWVTLGQESRLEEIGKCILDQVVLQSEGEKEPMEENDVVRLKLISRRYLIVMDDLWDNNLWDGLAELFYKFKNGSRILITTRLEQVSEYVSTHKFGMDYEYHQIQMSLMDKEDSWCLFCHKVFGEELCPFLLEEAGKEIVKKCDGLPLTIVTVAALLSKAEKTEKYWNEVAKKRAHSVFVEAYDQISKVLISSYNHLSQKLKPFFLYMGIFPQKFEIPTSKLINLWIAEGFGSMGKIKWAAAKYLRDLVSSNLLMAHHHSYDGRIKTSRLHSAFWQLCIRVARDNKFLYVISSYDDGLAECIKGQRRLCIHNNVLFSIKEVNNSMASISTAYSLLCTGQYHQYPVPICSSLSLLRILNALTIRFYEFPVEVLEIVSLRYLALTYNGEVPSSISKLRNLQFLIVHQHLSIKSSEDSSYLPMEIWDMSELEYLQIMGRDLPDPNGSDTLCRVRTLSDVSPRSCTKEVLGEFMFSLHKLGIRIEKGHVAAEILSCFDNLSELRHLESLKCVIMYPILMSEVVIPPPALLLKLPSSLEKLSLSGFGYGWENASKIASSLPNLKVFKLQSYAFRGPTWITHEGEFPRLEYLLIEDTDLVQWRSDSWCFPRLECLIIRHCYRLKEIPDMSQYSNFHMIEVVNSNPSVEIWAKQQGEEIKVRIERPDVRYYFRNLNLALKVKEIGSDEG